MRPAVVEPGERYGLLTVVSQSESRNGRRVYECRCDCGNTTLVLSTHLRQGQTKSCGCRERTTHGHKLVDGASPTYNSWKMMLTRCRNPQHKDWEFYGARGITVCDRWSRFVHFLEDMGERPEGTSLDRIDVLGNYEPGNCRWATREVQAKNTRRQLANVSQTDTPESDS